ncbi:MAG: VacJ family lipoprotein [Alphaproteobacteria bacterium]
MKIKSILFFLLSLSLNGCVVSGQSLNHDDKFEGYNRAMFSFNNTVDKYFLKPIAQGYLSVTPKAVQNRVNSIFSNIFEPVSAANHVLQGEFKSAGVNVARFGVNTTLGLLGSFDVASGWGLDVEKTNFDETLATWCVADGPFIILPFVGPATPRSAVGLAVDSIANPVNIASNSVTSEGDANSLRYGYAGANVIVARANAMPLLNDLEKNSVDYYTAMRSAYLQNRAATKCGSKQGVITYDFDFDME